MNRHFHFGNFSPQFWLLCSSNLLFALSFQMIIPELPDYLTRMGGQEYIGYIIALFTLTAGLSRPFSGKLTDTIGRMPIMIIGSLVCFICSGLYPFVSTVGLFLFLRLVHGFATGTKPTATAAYVADVTPADRRGEAQGLLGIFTATGMSVGPSLGGWIAANLSTNWLFICSSFFALLSILILVRMPETLPDTLKQRFTWKLLRIKRSEIIETSVLKTFTLMFLVSFPSGVLLTLIPSQTTALGFDNKGIYFTVYTLASLMMRVFFSQMSDRYGRTPIMYFSVTFQVIAMATLAFANQPMLFFLSAILFGCSWGFNTPTITAWTIDLSNAANRGKALATMYIGLEAGIGLGAWSSGFYTHGELDKFRAVYLFAALLSAISFGVLWWWPNPTKTKIA